MSAQNTLQFFGDDAVSAMPYGDIMPGLVRRADPVAEHDDSDDEAEQPMVITIELIWAAIAIASAFATAMFLAA